MRSSLQPLVLTVVLLVLADAGAATAPAGCVPSFHREPLPATGLGGLNDVLALAPDDVWAVGHSGMSDSDVGSALVVHRHGDTWEVVDVPGVPETSDLEALAGSARDDVWAVGVVWVSGQRRPLALHWDGSVWQRVSLPPLRGEGALLGVVAVAPDDAWAVGTPYGPTGAFTLHWNGVRWKQVRTPTAELLGDVVRLRRRVVAVGIRAHHGSNVPLVEQWSGGRWQVAYATTNKGTVWAAAAAGSVLWGVGAYSIFRWDARWHASRLPLPAAGYATDVTVGFGGTWVVVADEDPRPRSVLARSTGNGWVRAPALAASLAAIDADRERIWAAGTTGDRNGLALGEPLVGAYSC